MRWRFIKYKAMFKTTESVIKMDIKISFCTLFIVFLYLTFQKSMAEDNDRNNYGAVSSTQLINEDEQEEKVRSVDSFYEDHSGGNEDKGFLRGRDPEKRQLHNRRDGEQEERSNEDGVNHIHINGLTSTEKLQRPTRVSFSKEQPANQNHGAVTPVTPIAGRHVSFIEKANQNEPSDSGATYDNRGCSDMQSSSDSLSRVRAITNCSVHYHTHSEAEECNESDISLALSYRRSFSQTRRRRRRYTRRGTLVTDSFVNECICCCSIL